MIMIDIETLGTRPGSAIVQIGAVKFEPTAHELGAEFEGTISPVQPKMCIEGSTVRWWMNQSDSARQRVFPYQPDYGSLEDALDAFSRFYDGSPIWAHGVTFDIVLLEVAYHHHGRRPPWTYRDIRDTRTLFALRPDITLPFTGTEHNALDDARHQAKHVQAILRALA